MDKLNILSEWWSIPQEAALLKAVDIAFSQLLAAEGTRLIPREDNQYDVTEGGKTVATIDADVLKGLPAESVSNMLAEGELGGTALILLIAARNEKGITLYGLKEDPEED